MDSWQTVLGAALAAGTAALAPVAAQAQAAGVDASGAGQVAADEAATSPALWTAGLFMVAGSHPAYPGADHRVGNARVLPFITYRGPLLRVEGGSAGLRALRTPRYEFDFSAAGSFGSAGNDVKARAGMPSIGTLAEIGPSLRINLDADRPGGPRWRMALPLRAVFDVSRDFEHVGYSLEPRLTYSQPLTVDWRLSTSASLLFGDHQLTRLFYGVAPAYATSTRPAYDAKAGLIASSLTLSLSRAIGTDWRIGVFAGVESVAGAANHESPLVRRDVDGRIGVTLSWTAFRSSLSGVQ